MEGTKTNCAAVKNVPSAKPGTLCADKQDQHGCPDGQHGSQDLKFEKSQILQICDATFFW